MAVYTLDFVKYFKFTSNGKQFSFICWAVATQLGDRIFFEEENIIGKPVELPARYIKLSCLL